MDDTAHAPAGVVAGLAVLVGAVAGGSPIVEVELGARLGAACGIPAGSAMLVDDAGTLVVRNDALGEDALYVHCQGDDGHDPDGHDPDGHDPDGGSGAAGGPPTPVGHGAFLRDLRPLGLGGSEDAHEAGRRARKEAVGRLAAEGAEHIEVRVRHVDPVLLGADAATTWQELYGRLRADGLSPGEARDATLGARGTRESGAAR